MRVHEHDLRAVSWTCVHFTDRDDVDLLLHEAGLGGAERAIFRMDGAQILTKDDLLSQVARVMRFPEYFGHNWDALDECLRDMSWLPATSYVLFITQARLFWAEASGLAGDLVESWLLSAEEWSRGRVPFHLVFVW